jgi:hypothetical protein
MGDAGGIQAMLDQLKELEILISPDMTAHASLVTTGFNLVMFDRQDPQMLDKVKLVEEFISITVEGKHEFSLLRPVLESSNMSSSIQYQQEEEINSVKQKFTRLEEERATKGLTLQKFNKLKLPLPGASGVESTASTSRFLQPTDNLLSGRSQHQQYLENSIKSGSRIDNYNKVGPGEQTSMGLMYKRGSAYQFDTRNSEYNGRWNPDTNKVRSQLGKSLLYSGSSARSEGDTIFHILVAKK